MNYIPRERTQDEILEALVASGIDGHLSAADAYLLQHLDYERIADYTNATAETWADIQIPTNIEAVLHEAHGLYKHFHRHCIHAPDVLMMLGACVWLLGSDELVVDFSKHILEEEDPTEWLAEQFHWSNP